jgi:hypothetical protein
MAHEHPTRGSPDDDVVTVHAGETFNGGPGDDTITVVFSFPPTSTAPATVSGGPGDDTIIDESQSRDFSFPVTIDGGPGNDVIVSMSPPTLPGQQVYSGGPGHDLFEFTDATGSYAHIITDFSRHDAIQINSAPLDITYTNHGDFTEVVAVFQQSSGVVVDLNGHFDPTQFHSTTDAAGHTIITYGNSDFMLS